MKKLFLLSMIGLQILYAVGVQNLISDKTVSDSVQYKKKKYYKISVPKGKYIKVNLSELKADIDLYVKSNSLPAIRNNDCYSSKGSTRDEECFYKVTSDGEIYILVYGFRSSSFKLKVSILDNDSVMSLKENKEIKSEIKKGKSHNYKIAGKKGDKLIFKLKSSGGDSDLRVKIGKRANHSTFDCKSTKGYEKEDECAVILKKDASVYVNVYGYTDTSYSLLSTKDSLETYFGKTYSAGAMYWRIIKVTPSGVTTPKGATIRHYFDHDIGSARVIGTKGKGRENSYLFGEKRDNANFFKKRLFSDQKVSWKMKIAEKYRITFYAKTKNGYRKFYVSHSEAPNSFERGKVFYVNLGRKSMNNRWQRHTIDFDKVIKKYEPDNELIIITGVKINGSGLFTHTITFPLKGEKPLQKVTLQDGRVLQVSKNEIHDEIDDERSHVKLELIVTDITDNDNPKILIKEVIAKYTY